jgi:hypothetical protein
MYGGQLTTYYDAVYRSIGAAERELSPVAPSSKNEKPYRLDTIADDVCKKISTLYDFWQNRDTSARGGEVNILAGVSEADFLDMVRSADFSTLPNITGKRQRVMKTIHIISNFISTEWGEQAAKVIGTTLKECRKKTEFNEYSELKKFNF